MDGSCAIIVDVMNGSGFVETVISRVPEAESTVRQCLEDNDDELLLNLVIGDLRRLAIDWFRSGRAEALERLFAVLDQGFRDGDEYVANAVAISFIEDLGWWEPDMLPLIESLPAGMRVEVERQRSHGQ